MNHPAPQSTNHPAVARPVAGCTILDELAHRFLEGSALSPPRRDSDRPAGANLFRNAKGWPAGRDQPGRALRARSSHSRSQSLHTNHQPPSAEPASIVALPPQLGHEGGLSGPKVTSVETRSSPERIRRVAERRSAINRVESVIGAGRDGMH